MRTFDLTKEQIAETSEFDLTQAPPDLVLNEKLDYIIDLLETALRLEYLSCR